MNRREFPGAAAICAVFGKPTARAARAVIVAAKQSVAIDQPFG